MDRYDALEEVLDPGDDYNDNPDVEGYLGGHWWTKDGVTYLRVTYDPDEGTGRRAQTWTWVLQEHGEE